VPFLAELDGETVVPEQVGDGERATCHDCGDTVKPRSSYYREGDTFVARHFWHPSGQPEGCEAGGESAQHERMKSVAASKARDRWPDADVSLEESVGDRRADVLVSFEDTHHRLGDGLAIEVQYRNKGKDLEATESDFHDRRISVLWVREQQYDGKDVHLDRGEWSVWWVAEVPRVSEWTDRHDIVKWLEYIKNRNVSVKIPAKFPSELYLKQFEGVRIKSSERVEIEIRANEGHAIFLKHYDLYDNPKKILIKRPKWHRFRSFSNSLINEGSNERGWNVRVKKSMNSDTDISVLSAPSGDVCIKISKQVTDPNRVVGGDGKTEITVPVREPYKLAGLMEYFGNIQEIDPNSVVGAPV
jgi:hypothetical protein